MSCNVTMRMNDLQLYMTTWVSLTKCNVEGENVKYMLLIYNSIYKKFKGFSGSSVVKSLPPSSGDMSLIPGPGRLHMLQSN